MNKLAHILSGILLLLTIAATASEPYVLTIDDVYFNERTGTITSCKSEGRENIENKKVEIPSSFRIDGENIAVISIGRGVFLDRGIVGLIIPNSIVSIGDYAFKKNKITELDIPNSVTSLGNKAFEDNLIHSLKLSEGLMSISRSAFAGNVLTSVKIPSNVIKIEAEAFIDNKLSSVSIAPSVSEIDDKAFRNNELSSLVIPSTVLKIGNYAFADNNIQELELNFGLIEIQRGAFEKNALVSVKIPKTVKSIGSLAFHGNKLKSVEIPEGVTSIGTGTFLLNALTTISLPNSLQKLGNGAFKNNSITSVVIPNGLKVIEDLVFESNSITSVLIPEGVNYINYGAFSDNSLTKVEIPNSVVYIGKNAFYANTLTSFDLPVHNEFSKYNWQDGNDKVYTGGDDVNNLQVAYGIPGIYMIRYSNLGEGLNSSENPTVFHKDIGVESLKPAVRTGSEFLGWINNNNEPVNLISVGLEKDVRLRAKWKITQYKINFKDKEGKVFSRKVANHGYAIFPPAPPIYEGYTFSGWDKSVAIITSSFDVTALYTIKSYKVVFEDYDGSVLKTQTVEHGKAAIAPPLPSHTDVIIVGWDNDFDKITNTLTIRATTKNRYTVTFKDHDGTVLKSEKVEEGANATAPKVPVRPTYIFKGWDKELSNVTEDLVITAQYNLRIYAVVFKDHDETVLKTEGVEHGSSATAPSTPTREGHVFLKWSKDFSEITSHLIVTAYYTSENHTVIFEDYDGTVLSEHKNVLHGSTLDAPKDKPVRTGYTFNGWNKAYKDVSAAQITSDLRITAQYQKNIYEVVFKDHDGHTLKTEKVEHEMSATAPENPVRNNYKFIGWDKSYDSVMENLVVTAQYDNTTGISTVDTTKPKCYPNPVKDVLNVDLSNSPLHEYSGLTVINSRGKTVYMANDKAPVQTIDMSQFNSGVYFIRVNNNTVKVLKK